MPQGHSPRGWPTRAREEAQNYGRRKERKCIRWQRPPQSTPLVSTIFLLSLLVNSISTVKSNIATDLPPSQRISDKDILNNINTFMFAGSDTTSLALTWTLQLLAQHPTLQSRLREELLSVAPSSESRLTPDEIESLYNNALVVLPFLHNVTRESLRLIPPLHSSLRVAMQDDEVPTSYPVHFKKPDGTVVVEEGRSVTVPKGSFVHVPVEAFNVDREIWGADAWEFKCVELSVF
jgi:hypothetical protein